MRFIYSCFFCLFAYLLFFVIWFWLYKASAIMCHLLEFSLQLTLSFISVLSSSTLTKYFYNRRYVLLLGNKIFNSPQLLAVCFSGSQNANILLLFFLTSDCPDSALLLEEQFGDSWKQQSILTTIAQFWADLTDVVVWLDYHSFKDWLLVSWHWKLKATILLTQWDNIAVCFIFEKCPWVHKSN